MNNIHKKLNNTYKIKKKKQAIGVLRLHILIIPNYALSKSYEEIMEISIKYCRSVSVVINYYRYLLLQTANIVALFDTEAIKVGLVPASFLQIYPY